MNDLQASILYSLETFKLAIAVDIGNKIIILNPRILESISIDDIARALSASDLRDEEILEGIRVIDKARKPPFESNKKA